MRDNEKKCPAKLRCSVNDCDRALRLALNDPQANVKQVIAWEPRKLCFVQGATSDEDVGMRGLLFAERK